MKLKLAVLLLLVVLSACTSSQSDQDMDHFEVFRGTNLAHWLSQSNRRGEARAAYITQADIQNIKSMGFDHVRLPVDEEQLWDSSGVRHQDAFRLLTQCIEWCVENDLRIIVDLHILRSHYFNTGDNPLWTDPVEQEKFVALWMDLSNALKEYPNNRVAYELMNEPVADEPDQWNDLVRTTVARIREQEPRRTLLIGSNRWQSVATFEDLYIPENDPHIILTFHYYDPFLLTHWNASWTALRSYTGPVHYPGVLLEKEEYDQLPDSIHAVIGPYRVLEYDKSHILEEWSAAIKVAKRHGLDLYCGEFGVIKKAPDEDRLRWYQDMIELFEENQIGYANWNYKSDNFGLVNGGGQPNSVLIDIVSGE
ncbi:glycoside hydrolase family 5 protein [Membranicola marinus]|uniref:Glycoside hydrolase family 5 protein n=1 Tax=Membranihabitans marinus TaxID=1227546 RepID=A0A953HYQ1_9BACT|nr:glycoside hydrolase family 5 protein [Membranihabitans marinus]MBY5959116.1 glycoside hydrolase family 5 protein [Membranihabitans marinus]